MNATTTLPNNDLARWTALWRALWARHAASAATQRTRDTAASLYVRAACYERTQPGFAADLRAAAEGLDRLAAESLR
jgi:hypothetical protein